jgi:hypothetical protein
MQVLVGGYSTLSIEASKYFRAWKEHCSLEVEVPRLFSVAGVFPGVRDGYYFRLSSFVRSEIETLTTSKPLLISPTT